MRLKITAWKPPQRTRLVAAIRNTCARHLVKNNANLRHVQDLLGHRSLATTERYLRLTITDLKEAHRKFHPRERKDRH